MSNASGTSSGSSKFGGKVRFVGVPKRCWCGEEIVAKTSKSDPNPCRRYFRCGFAYSKKLMNNNHTFKWVDEALLDGVLTLKEQSGRLHGEMKELITETMKQQKMAFENLQKELEKEIFEKVEDVFMEAKAELKTKMTKMMLVVIFGWMIMIAVIKLLS